ncbi:L-aspartate oxidase [uncultured Corynebacterium sp.]|uniref:L-aspartate oxidase n=1 Tax=uncultured Corynebacterium sp. TaxID=159447 RepID=UPI0025D18578|nr:FAD-binding protein [uncultured Corynebacterium sp.]
MTGFDWAAHCDLLVIGGGVAGLAAVRRGRELGLDVMLVDKGHWSAGARGHLRFDGAATNLAQGGLAVVGLPDAPGGLDDDGADSVELHVADTLDAGAGHCDEDAVRAILGAGAEATEWLIGLGARFDRVTGEDGDGGASERDAPYSRTREGGHGHRRIIHAGGDATGAEIQRALEESVSGVRVLQNAVAEEIIVDDDSTAETPARAHGALIRDPRGLGAVTSAATLIATGGVGHLFRSTTAPDGLHGQGHCLALDAGAELADMEFIQFHPTVLFDRERRGRRPLISEAVRGEGARLVDSRGVSVTAGVDPRGDLAPRDIVSRAIATRLRELGEDCVFLDARGVDDVRERFPTVTAGVATAGLDPARDLLPVAPAVHYSCGGIATDVRGRTRVPGLYAAGECARTGLHGANRLASNSLLEGLVVGRAAAEDVAAAVNSGQLDDVVPADVRRRRVRPRPWPRDLDRLQKAMTDGAGVTRTAESLGRAAHALAALPDTAEVAVARVIVAAAAARTSTLGCHTRLD